MVLLSPLRGGMGATTLLVALLLNLQTACGVTLKMQRAVLRRDEQQATPVSKVIEMLEGMIAKGNKMMEAEKNTFAEYAKWVDSRTTELKQEMSTQQTSIEELTATIEKAITRNGHLTKEIKKLDAEMDKASQQKQEASALRASERSEFQKTSDDLSESVDALDRAIQQMQAQNYDRPQAEALLQRMATRSPFLQPALAAFLHVKNQDTDSDTGAPSVAAYKFQSQGILDVLGELKNKFEDTLSDLQADEENKAHAHDVESLHLTNLIAQMRADREEKATKNAAAAALAARSKSELADTQADLAENQKMLTEIEATYTAKGVTFEMNQKVRSEELKALTEAKEIIDSAEVADSYSDNISEKPASLLQTSATARSKKALSQQKAAALLRSHARALSSQTLMVMASQLASKPFEKVITMIEGLLAKLKEEAAAEAEHKAWCDKELKRNKEKRDKKSFEADKLTASISEMQATIETMTERLAELAEEQAQLTASLKEATELRQKEKAENEETIKDARAGQEAVKRALAVLRKFYSAQGALLQHEQAPALESYKGMTGSKKGVVGMLEVIESDFARLLTDTLASEEQAAREYKTFAEETAAVTEEKRKAEVKLKLEKDQVEFTLERAQESLAGVQEELQKANEYYDYLKPTCVEVHVSFEERMQHREEEIAALKEAYQVLSEKSSE